jgi:branched-chain amino acid transport system substrate-binding protein
MLSCLLVATRLVAASGPGDTRPVIKIGVIAPFSGDSSFLGKTFKEAADLAIRDIQSQPTRFRYEFIFEDDQYQGRLTNLAAQKLISQDHVSALSSVGSVAGNVIKPLAAKSGVLHFNDSFDTSIADGKTNFVHTTPPEVLARQWVSLAKEKGWKRVAIVEAVFQACKQTCDDMEKESTGSGITLIRDFKVIPGERDFRTFILKIRQAKPDAVFIMTLLPEVDILGRQIREQEPKIPLTSVWSFDIVGDRTPFVGSYYVSTGAVERPFLLKYRAAYGHEAPQNDLLNSYDYLKLMVYGFEHAKCPGIPTGRDAARVLLEKRDFNSLLGHIECTPQGVFLSPASVRLVTKEGSQIIQ